MKKLLETIDSINEDIADIRFTKIEPSYRTTYGPDAKPIPTLTILFEPNDWASRDALEKELSLLVSRDRKSLPNKEIENHPWQVNARDAARQSDIDAATQTTPRY